MSDDVSLLDLFRDEVRSHGETLAAGLLEFEQAGDPRRIEPLMRAAHSIKGAARIVGIEPAVRLAHVMEDVFVAAQERRIAIAPADVDVLLRGTDLLRTLADVTETTKTAWGVAQAADLVPLVERLKAMAVGGPSASEGAAGPSRDKPPSFVGVTRALPDGRASDEPALPTQVVPVVPDAPLWELFRDEVRQAADVLEAGIAHPVGEPMLDAARAIRGAAAIVRLPAPADLGAAMEQALAALVGRDAAPDVRDGLRVGVSVLMELVALSPEEAAGWQARHGATVADLTRKLLAAKAAPAEPPPARMPVGPPAAEPAPAEAVVRVTAESLTRLMSLAGESLVQARWLGPFSTALLKLKKHQDHLAGLLDAIASGGSPTLIDDARRQLGTCRDVLAERTREFDEHAARAEDLNARLYREVIVSRMRPFRDGAHGFPRLVRDMARSLGKNVRLDIQGLATEVDRDILERLEAPLNHLLRNAVDHGIEPPERRGGKPEQGTIRLDVRHRAGTLAITVGDDGAGIDPERLRVKVVERGLTTADLARTMSDAELLEFLFLPGFSTAGAVTEYSGRGVGLDVVQTTIRQIGGTVRADSRPGRGTTFHLTLPVTLSVVRAVLVTVAGEPYAFPHHRIDRLLRVKRDEIRSVEHRQFVTVDGRNVGLVQAAQMFDLPGAEAGPVLDVVLLSDEGGTYGLLVEGVRGEQDLVVRPLDPRLGKVPDVAAAAILDDGTPVLIADVEDLIRSMDAFIQSGTLRRCDVATKAEEERPRRRVLVVDDSITVREVERQLLKTAGYEVAVAVDGADGWNAVRQGRFDLVVTDVDMPRMNGLELLRTIRSDERLASLPVVIVSYKDRPEDRRRGLDLGANYYLTKSSFHDDTFLRAVADLIGEG